MAEAEGHDLDALRKQLDAGRSGLLTKFSDRLSHIENIRIVFGGAALVGALIAGLARLLIEPYQTIAMALGLTLVACSGAITLMLDRRKFDITQEAKQAHSVAANAIELAAAADDLYERVSASADELDRRRRARLLAIRSMFEAYEAALISGSGDVQSAENMLERAIGNIRRAIDYQGTDYLTVTIFRKEGARDTACMRQIAAQWTDPQLAALGRRTWVRGKGYTGVAWRDAETNPNAEVIIEDTSLPHIANQFPVDNRNAAREELYRSVASIPILINRTENVWGIVTATSNRPGVFSRQGGESLSQNVDMIRDIARLAPLLNALDRRVDAG